MDFRGADGGVRPQALDVCGVSYRNPWEKAHLSEWPLPSPQGPQVLPTFQGEVSMEQSVTSPHGLIQQKKCHDS